MSDPIRAGFRTDSPRTRISQMVAACLLMVLLVACGPADYLLAPDLPPAPTGTITPWRPVAVRTAAPTRPLDNSALIGVPCAPPCWQGLQAGVTTADEVKRFLENSPLVQGWEGETTPDGDEIYRWQWSPPVSAGSDQANEMRVRDGVLLRITLQPDTPVALSQVVETLGAPIWTDAPDVTADQPEQTLHLYYPEHGLLVVVGGVERAADGSAICPSATAPVAWLVYLPAGAIEDVVAAFYDLPALQEAALARLREWDGVSCLALDE